MRVVVTGASGNVGSAVVTALSQHPQVDQVVGVCRRAHDWAPPRTTWHWLDVSRADLAPVMAGADVVIHLAWLFHPMRSPAATWMSNAVGSARVFKAAVDAGVDALVVASSVGAYSTRANLDPVDETWPTHGIPGAAYSREKAYVERMLDTLESTHHHLRIVRMRPGFIFQPSAAVQQRRLFLGPLVPNQALPGVLPVLPLPANLRLPAVHTEDVASAYVTAATEPVNGSFNLAADPALTPQDLAEVMGARWVDTPSGLLRGAMAAAYGVRAIPAAPGVFDMLMSVPVMDTRHAREVLGWQPRHSPADAVRAFLAGLHDATRDDTPPLTRSTSGLFRWREWATGVGARAG